MPFILISLFCSATEREERSYEVQIAHIVNEHQFVNPQKNSILGKYFKINCKISNLLLSNSSIRKVTNSTNQNSAEVADHVKKFFCAKYEQN